MITVDTNVLAYLWLPGDLTPFSIQTLKKNPVWIAPILWRSEFRNILTRYYRSGYLSLDIAADIMKQAEQLMKGAEIQPSSKTVLQLIASSNLTPYDCEFVALAMDFHTPLVTSDKKLLSAFPDITISLRKYAQDQVLGAG